MRSYKSLVGDPGRTRTSDQRFRKPRLGKSIQELSSSTAVNPPTNNQRLSGVLSNLPPPAQKKTAAPAGPRNGGDLIKKRGNTSKGDPTQRRIPLTRLRGLFNDEGHFFGWEVA